jgi:hypothetical protein
MDINYIKEGIASYKVACNQTGEISNVIRNHVHILVFKKHLIILKEHWEGYRFFKTTKELKKYLEEVKARDLADKKKKQAEEAQKGGKEGQKDIKDIWLDEAAELEAQDKSIARC